MTVVFVMVNGEARARPVKTGISDQERIEILEGLGPDDEVIVGPFRVLDEMEEGQPVKLEEFEKEPASSESAAKPDAETRLRQTAPRATRRTRAERSRDPTPKEPP